MAMKLFQQSKRQKYLILIFIVLVIAAVFVLIWQNVLQKQIPGIEVKVISFRKPDINFKILENPILKGWQSFERIKAFKEEKGRENPFLLAP